MRKAGKGQSEEGARQELQSLCVLLFYLEREWQSEGQCLHVEGGDQSAIERTENGSKNQSFFAQQGKQAPETIKSNTPYLLFLVRASYRSTQDREGHFMLTSFLQFEIIAI
jgi:hypothetical protein